MTEDDDRLDDVLTAISDEETRELLGALDRPKSARTLAEETGIPLSSVYRLLDHLTEASLIEERHSIRTDGHHVTKYATNFSAITLRLCEDRSLELEVERDVLRPVNEQPSPERATLNDRS